MKIHSAFGIRRSALLESPSLQQQNDFPEDVHERSVAHILARCGVSHHVLPFGLCATTAGTAGADHYANHRRSLSRPEQRPLHRVNAIKTVEALDFTIAAPGHGPVGTKADIVAHRQYFENLGARVSAGIAAGRTTAQLQAAAIMDEYKGWIEYDEDNDVNIANVYKTPSAQKR